MLSDQLGSNDTKTYAGSPASTAMLTRLAREQRARRNAEKAAEKQRVLLERTRSEMQELLSGGIAMMTDVLALAKPELFQKATKVQRWARILAPKLELSRPWELDLAAILYPYGLISLPDNVVAKYASGKKLSNEEQAMIDQSTVAGSRVVKKMPRMEHVADAIYYSRKGFDGTGFPTDQICGEELPLTARILCVLIDLADLCSGPQHNRAKAFAKMVAQREKYDLKVLKLAHELLLDEENEGREKTQKRVLSVGELLTHDVVGADIVDGEGRLLLASGSELTELCIQRLVLAHRDGRLMGKVEILRTT